MKLLFNYKNHNSRAYLLFPHHVSLMFCATILLGAPKIYASDLIISSGTTLANNAEGDHYHNILIDGDSNLSPTLILQEGGG